MTPLVRTPSMAITEEGLLAFEGYSEKLAYFLRSKHNGMPISKKNFAESFTMGYWDTYISFRSLVREHILIKGKGDKKGTYILTHYGEAYIFKLVNNFLSTKPSKRNNKLSIKEGNVNITSILEKFLEQLIDESSEFYRKWLLEEFGEWWFHEEWIGKYIKCFNPFYREQLDMFYLFLEQNSKFNANRELMQLMRSEK